MNKISLIGVFALVSSPALAADSIPTLQELWQIVQAQQEQIVALEAANKEANSQLAATRQQVEATTEYVENVGTATASPSWADRTQIGGYGEVHYNNLQADDATNDLKEIDVHRFVLYANHQFNDRLRLATELELEHSLAGEGKNGEVELEQAYIEYDLNDEHQIRGGLFLMPVGILNETHEPNTFYGVERNDVESIIIPSTWWEAGAATGGRYASGLSWDLALTSGLEMPTTGSSAFRVRSGRQKVSEADASSLAYTARVKYTGVPGLELSGTAHLQNDASQISNDGLDEGRLLSAHAIYNAGGFGLRALWARWDFDGDAVEAADADKQTGWYIEPSYKWQPGNYAIGIYSRYEDVKAARIQDQFDQWEVGLNYWPVDNVVVKFDYRDRSHDLPSAAGRDFDGFDLGIGYAF